MSNIDQSSLENEFIILEGGPHAGDVHEVPLFRVVAERPDPRGPVLEWRVANSNFLQGVQIPHKDGLGWHRYLRTNRFKDDRRVYEFVKGSKP